MHRADTEEANSPWVEEGSPPSSSLAGTNVTVAVSGIFHFFAPDAKSAGNQPFTARFPALCTTGIPTERARTTSVLRQDPTTRDRQDSTGNDPREHP